MATPYVFRSIQYVPLLKATKSTEHAEHVAFLMRRLPHVLQNVSVLNLSLREPGNLTIEHYTAGMRTLIHHMPGLRTLKLELPKQASSCFATDAIRVQFVVPQVKTLHIHPWEASLLALFPNVEDLCVTEDFEFASEYDLRDLIPTISGLRNLNRLEIAAHMQTHDRSGDNSFEVLECMSEHLSHLPKLGLFGPDITLEDIMDDEFLSGLTNLTHLELWEIEEEYLLKHSDPRLRANIERTIRDPSPWNVFALREAYESVMMKIIRAFPTLQDLSAGDCHVVVQRDDVGVITNVEWRDFFLPALSWESIPLSECALSSPRFFEFVGPTAVDGWTEKMGDN